MTTLRAAIFLVGKSCFQCADADDIEKSRCRSLFVACLFVTGEVVDAKADNGERDDYFARCHFLGGKSRSRAPRPTTLKRGVGFCLLRFLLLQERSSTPTSEKEKTRRRLCLLPFFWVGRVAFDTRTSTTSRRVDVVGLCLLRVFLLQERTSMRRRTSERETMTLPGAIFWVERVAGERQHRRR